MSAAMTCCPAAVNPTSALKSVPARVHSCGVLRLLEWPVARTQRTIEQGSE